MDLCSRGRLLRGRHGTFFPGVTACLACIFFPEPPSGMVETCDTSGILNPAVNLAASLEAVEAIKWIVGAHDRMRRTLFSCDVWNNEIFRDRHLVSAIQLAWFAHSINFHISAAQAVPRVTLCGRNLRSSLIHEHHRPIDFAELTRKLEAHGTVRSNEMLLRFDRGQHRITIFKDGRAIVQGTTDVGIARSLYSRFIGS